MRRSIACFAVVLFSLAITGKLMAQSNGAAAMPPGQASADPSSASAPLPAAPSPAPTYPQVKSYLSFIIPWVTINKNATTTEFETATTIGFPVGINVLYSKHFGFSYEITPSVLWQKSAGKSGTSKESNLLFDPGPIFRFSHGINLVTRLAFETGGRYGFTPVFNKVYLRTQAVDYWFSLSAPVRFGNNLPASVGGNLQIGFTFN